MFNLIDEPSIMLILKNKTIVIIYKKKFENTQDIIEHLKSTDIQYNDQKKKAFSLGNR